MNLPQHLFIASDGALHDCRMPDWAARPIRTDYSRHFVNIRTCAQFKATVRAGCYAWPGGYPLYFLCDDGGSLCFDCAADCARDILAAIHWRRRDGWRVIACDVNWEDDLLTCDHCNNLIESAYG